VQKTEEVWRVTFVNSFHNHTLKPKLQSSAVFEQREWPLQPVVNSVISPELQHKILSLYFDQGQDVQKIFQQILQTRMIWRQQIVDFLSLFAAPSYSRIFDLDIPNALINRFY
jgi:hypothetical protein